MEQRKIGKFKAAPIGMGCMGITHASGAPMAKTEGVKVIQEAFNLGYTFFDTGECYTGVYPDGSTAVSDPCIGFWRALRVRNGGSVWLRYKVCSVKGV